MPSPKKPNRSERRLRSAIQHESKDFEQAYLWLESHMPNSFFEEIEEEKITLVTHSLMSLHLQDNFSQVHFREGAIVLCPDSPEADVQVLKHYEMHGIQYYRSFISNTPLHKDKLKRNLRVTLVLFTEISQKTPEVLSQARVEELLALVKRHSPEISDTEFQTLLKGMSPRFLRSMNTERLSLALDLFFRAKTSDACQYQVRYHEDWKEKEISSLQIVLAWKNVPKYRFLLNLAEMILRHNLDMQKVVATYIDPYSTESILLLSFALQGRKGLAAWEEADISDFLQELACLHFFEHQDLIERVFIQPRLLTGNLGNLIRCMTNFVHQTLVYADPNLYSLSHIEEGFCRHQELTAQLAELFELKFHPIKQSLSHYEQVRNGFLRLVDNLDTGHPNTDTRRKTILKQALHFVDFTLKTNFYRINKTSFSFRLDPKYLDRICFSRREKFPELPYAIFLIQGRHFLGFHIRFKDLSRGGLRTIFPERVEQFVIERNQVFLECYNLAYTQHKKNKDIPEGGSKGVILLEPFEKSYQELVIYKKEMENAEIPAIEMEENLQIFRKLHKREYLYQAQRSFIQSFLTLINCEEDGTLKADRVVDYYHKPEYIYLGPDENMHTPIIEWIAQHSEKQGYKPQKSFITSKSSLGINHKEFGVTSLGVMVYVHQMLLHLGIDPEKDPFTIKISGGPDGDVAGNLIYQLHKKYPHTAKLVALTDISGTIYDPEGLNLLEMVRLFYEAKPIRYYPAEKLSEGGFLLDLHSKREQTAYIQQTLCYRKQKGELVSDWLSGSDMNHLYRYNVHQALADIFVPAGGRPRTINENNYQDFLEEKGKPTSKAIVEGANLYLTHEARLLLEKLGVFIIKDSSANKGGVICSSLEVLSTLVLSEDEFIQYKTLLVPQILHIIEKTALEEASLLFRTWKELEIPLIEGSEKISQKINTYKYEILDYLELLPLPQDFHDPLIRSLFLYVPPLLREKFTQRILKKVPEVHKKAIIACYIASCLVYSRGLNWSPSVIDILPLLAQDLEEDN